MALAVTHRALFHHSGQRAHHLHTGHITHTPDKLVDPVHGVAINTAVGVHGGNHCQLIKAKKEITDNGLNILVIACVGPELRRTGLIIANG